VLQLFWGDRTWQYGWDVPPLVLEQCVASGPVVAGPPPLPGSVAALLRDCFERDPAERPPDFEAIAARLTGIYEEAAGTAYGRPRPEPGALLADQLNNKALSLLDLGREEEAERLRWRGAITDLELVARLEEVRASHGATGRRSPRL